MPRQRRVLSSWRSNEAGDLVEGDLKIYVDEEDGSYELESIRESIGVTLGPDKSKKYTVICRIMEPDKMTHFKSTISVGDVLLAINDQPVLEDGFEKVSEILKEMISVNRPRKLKFLNPRKNSLSLYKKKLAPRAPGTLTDMYGFVCSHEEFLLEREFYRVYSGIRKHRDHEWVEYLKSIGGAENLKPAGVYKPSKDLKQMCRQGIPVAYRCLVWQKISMSSLYKLHYPANYYATLVSNSHTLKDKKVFTDIEKDVDRTFPEHAFFAPGGEGENALRRVLQAFALHNPEIGYCQSLNFVAGMMLLFLSEDEAFWLLVTVVEKLLPKDYYTKSMVGTYVDQFVLAHIIKKYLPRIHSTLDSHSLQLPLITVQWFMCLFVNTLRPTVALRVWDIFLNEGNKVLFRIAAALFKLHESRLCVVKDASELFSVLRTIGRDVYDADALISLAYSKYSTEGVMKKVRSSPHLHAAAANQSSASNASSASSHVPVPSYVTPSPRLSHRSGYGAVPAQLVGVGLAHVGPRDTSMPPVVDLYRPSSSIEMSKKASSVGDDGALSQVDDGMGSLSPQASFSAQDAFTLTQAFTEAAKGVEKTLMEQEEEVAALAEAAAASEQGDVPAEGEQNGKQYEEEVIQVDHDPVFTHPELLMSSIPLSPTSDTNNRSSESSSPTHTPNPLSDHIFTATYKPHKLKSHARRLSGGNPSAFHFSRSEILVWRASFRPALEERYERMESARVQWRKMTVDGSRKSTRPVSMTPDAEGQSAGQTDEASDDNMQDDADSLGNGKKTSPHVVSPTHRGSFSMSSPPNSPLPNSPLSLSSPSPRPSLTHRPSLTDVLRRSSLTHTNGAHLDETTHTAVTYTIDQEIEVGVVGMVGAGGLEQQQVEDEEER